MLISFKVPEFFLRSVVFDTKKGKIRWEINSSGGFIQQRDSHNSSFLLFDEIYLTLTYRALSEDFDVVISSDMGNNYADLLVQLYEAIKQQVGVLF